MSDLIERAKEFATRAHAGQFLNNLERDPMIIHPEAVAKLVAEASGTEEEIAAAWLHDVVEDTNRTIEDIRNEFGDAIAEIVEGLTDPPHFAPHASKVRKKMQADRILSMNKSVKKIKIADQTYNVHLTGFGHLKWPPEERLDYAEGARSIVANCRGVSKMLEELFDKTYLETIERVKTEITNR